MIITSVLHVYNIRMVDLCTAVDTVTFCRVCHDWQQYLQDVHLPALETPTKLLDHTYGEHPDVAPLPQSDMEHSFTVNTKYADDFTYASTSEGEINRTKATVLEQLDVYNLHYM